MKPLVEVIEALSRELGSRQATAALQCVAIEQPKQPLRFMVLTNADKPRGPIHTVTVAVGLPAATAAALPGEPSSTPTVIPSGAASSQAPSELICLLTSLFGEPGFDNAARASVFHEIFESLSPGQIESLFNELRRDASEVPLEKAGDSAVAMARTRLVRLLKLGPSSYPGGLKVMFKALELAPLSALLQLVAARWKTQSDWIETKPPGVSFGA